MWLSVSADIAPLRHGDIIFLWCMVYKKIQVKIHVGFPDFSIVICDKVFQIVGLMIHFEGQTLGKYRKRLS